MLDPLGMKEGEAIESRMVTRRIEGGPEEGRRTQLRGPQEPARIRRGDGRAAEAGLRLPPANSRRRQLPRADPRMIDKQIDQHARRVPQARLRPELFAAFASQQPGRRARSPRLPRHGLHEPPTSYARTEAERTAEAQVLDAIEENLPRRGRRSDRASGTGKRWPRWPTPAGG